MTSKTPFNVLIVDDDPILLGALAGIARSVDGVSLHTASTGADAVRAATEHRPGLIIADMGLPDMTGEEVCRQVRKKLNGHCLKIWLITGKPSSVERHVLKEIGASGLLVKPFGSDVIRSVIAEAMDAQLSAQ